MQRSQVVPVALIASLLGTALVSAEAAKTTAPAGVAAQVGDKKITLEELDKKVDAKAFQALFDARKATLEQMIADLLMEKEAKDRGVTVDALKKTEVTDKSKPVSDADVQAFYDQNKNNVGGQTFEAIKDRMKQYLEVQAQEAARASFILDLKKKTGVKLYLDPPRTTVAVMADDPSKGPANAPIQIVEFSEFQCPFCSRVGPAVKKVEETYGDKIRLTFRHYPLPMHAQAPGAANASECAREQGKFWEYHDKLFANQQALQVEKLKQYAVDLGLDATKFNACVDGNKFAEGVKKDQADGNAAGVNGTPAFFVNGRLLSGAQPFEAFKAIIDEELDAKGVKH